MTDRYNIYSRYLKEHYGEKVYRLPIELDLTCPNRDGRLRRGGCIYCHGEGSNFENKEEHLSIHEQLERDRQTIENKYNAHKFMSYFQNYSNTYMPLELFRKYINEAVVENVIAISVSTRPDCITVEHLEILKQLQQEKHVDIIIELGLQTSNNKTLKIINRQHTVADFIRAYLMIKKYGFKICTHVILALPWDDMDDVRETAKLLSVLKVDEYKIHSLYIPKHTILAKWYEEGKVQLKSLNGYVNEVCEFLKYLDKDILIQRLVGRIPEEGSVFCNWNTSHWKIQDMIIEKMERENIFQGNSFDEKMGIII